jgi:hypothetical protein
MKEKCPCPYCENASPYQTFAYRELERQRKEDYLCRQQAKLLEHQNAYGDATETQGGSYTELSYEQDPEEDYDGLDEIERKRRERKRIREERRKLKQAVDEAEAAVAEAKAIAEAAKQHHGVTTTEKVSPAAAHAEATPEQKPCAVPDSGVSAKINQWNSAPLPQKDHPYAVPPPGAGCRCVIM